MLLPAVYSMRLNGTLPTDFALVGFARSKYDDETFREYCRAQLDAFMPAGKKPEGTSGKIFPGAFATSAPTFAMTRDFVKLKELLARTTKSSAPAAIICSISRRRRRSFRWSFSASRRPASTAIPTAADGRASLSRSRSEPISLRRGPAARIDKSFPESAVYRIDHFLGKEPVQDIIALRFANTIFEPIWNRNYVANVQITAAESIGVEERGGYYDHAGALRDMIQNHVINLLALVAMEPPVSSHADDIRNEKSKVLNAIAPPPTTTSWRWPRADSTVPA